MMKELILALVLAVSIFSETVNGCSCTDQTQVDRTGKEIGRCLTKFGGKSWCYIASTSSCPDKKQSSRSNQLYWSSQACQNKGQGSQNTGQGSQNKGQGSQNKEQGNGQGIRVVAGSGGGDRVPTCTTVDGASCVFPFKYNGKGYRGCTLDGADGGVAWCSTKVDQNGNHVKGNVGNCPSECPTDPGYFIGSQDFGALGGSNSSTRGASDASLLDIYNENTDFAEHGFHDPWPQYACKMYEHCHHRGSILLIPSGVREHSIRPWNFNDKASSFRVRSGCRLNVWEHDNYKGRAAYVPSGSIKCVEGSWNDVISSIQCVC